MPLLVRALLALAAALPLACSAADSSKYQLGTHYNKVRAPQPTSDPSKIEVMEVFAYSCPHCFQFEPHLDRWLAKKPADVNFLRLPHTLGNPAATVRNKAMYTAHMLGGFDKFHRALFGAIHGQSRPMTTVEEVRGLFVDATGLTAADFDGAYLSFAVDSRNRIAESAVRDMGINSVPALVIEGKYFINPRAGGGFAEMLAVADFLVAQARAERGKAR